MKNHCSFRSGGLVRVFALPPDEVSLVSLCTFLQQHGITPYLLGNGTNVVFPDDGAENLFDENKFPQSFEAKRSFVARTAHMADKIPELPRESGRLATFVIRLLFRQHASWQGLVTWVESKVEEPFRSVRVMEESSPTRKLSS